MNREAVIANLTAAIKSSGETMKALSLAAGRNETYIHQFINKTSPQRLPEDVRVFLAKRLKISEQLLGGPAESDNRSQKISLIPNTSSPSIQRKGEMPKDVPVLGTAAGSAGEGSFRMDRDSVIDTVRRPAGILNAIDVYAVYVSGDSMSPRFEHGELVYVSENRPTRPGDYVVVQIKTEEHADIQAYIKRLNRQTSDTLFLTQLNPERPIQHSMATVVSIHRILTMNDLFGI